MYSSGTCNRKQSIPNKYQAATHYVNASLKGTKLASFLFLKPRSVAFSMSNTSVTTHKYTYSNIVSEDISDFSCLSL